MRLVRLKQHYLGGHVFLLIKKDHDLETQWLDVYLALVDERKTSVEVKSNSSTEKITWLNWVCI